MTILIADIAMSLDGFVADTKDDPSELFGWYFAGDVEVPTPQPGFSFMAPEASARVLRDGIATIGALIGGRRYFDLANGWGGNHPMGVPTFIVTHQVPDGWPREDSNIRFVTDGLDSAVEQAKVAAGDKNVAVATPSIAQQLLDRGDSINSTSTSCPSCSGPACRSSPNSPRHPSACKDPRSSRATASPT